MCPVLSPGSCWTRDLWSQMATVSRISESKVPTPTQSTLCHDTCSKVLEIRTLGPREHEPLNLLQSDCRWRPQTSRNPNVARCKCRTIQVWERTENPWKSHIANLQFESANWKCIRSVWKPRSEAGTSEVLWLGMGASRHFQLRWLQNNLHPTGSEVWCLFVCVCNRRVLVVSVYTILIPM